MTDVEKRYRKRRVERRLAQGLCTSCGEREPEEGHRWCAECLAKNSAKKKAERQKAIAEGLCVECHKNKARDGKRMCLKCALVDAERSLKYYYKKQRGVDLLTV